MSDSGLRVGRLHDAVHHYNSELEFEGRAKIILGAVFSFFVFGFVYCLGWFFGLFFASSLYLDPWQFGLLLAMLFLAVATWSAWRRVDPLAELPRLTDEQMLLTLVSQATPGVLYFSPRHATAGAALVLLGGPVSVFEGWGILNSRIQTDEALIEAASRTLEDCETACPVEEVTDARAALLLRRLSLIKVIPNDDSSALTVTEKGLTVLSGPRERAPKRSTTPGRSKKNRR
jgi:hypothetical protein